MKGPIRKGPTEYVPCVTCSRLFSTKERKLRVGIPKRTAKQHLIDHRMGRIRRPKEAAK